MTSGRRALLWVVLVGLAVVFAAPIIAMIVLSLQADESVVAVDQGSIRAFIPRSISLQNYQDALNRRGAARSLVNTGLITFVTVGAGLVVNSMCAFALARLRWPGRRAVLAGVVALMIVPFQTLAVPLLLIVNRFGWLDTYHVQIIPFVANPFYIFLFYLSFAELSSEIEEAAILDGAGRWTIYRRMVVPLSRPIFATVAVLHGLAIWGSFLWPLMVTPRTRCSAGHRRDAGVRRRKPCGRHFRVCEHDHAAGADPVLDLPAGIHRFCRRPTDLGRVSCGVSGHHPLRTLPDPRRRTGHAYRLTHPSQPTRSMSAPMRLANRSRFRGLARAVVS